MRTQALHRHPERQADFTVHAYSLAAATAVAASKIAGETIVVAVSQKPTVSVALNGASQ